jgi:NSS family neurotransmitter:Na+ symporter
VWIAAYGQVFFSIGVAFSIMIAYSSYLPRRSELPNSGFIVALSNSGFEFFAAIGVFSVLGFLAVQQNTEVNEVATEGVGLAFIAFPQIINQLPALQSFFGFLFFGALLFAGLTSAVSILEVGVIAVRDKFGFSRNRAVIIVCGLAFLIGLIYVTKGGLYYLDTVDHFVNNYGLVLSGLVEVILVAWVVRQLRNLQRFLNEESYIPIGYWWILALSIITPIILIGITAFNIYNEFANPYEGYPASGLLILGGGATVLAIVLGFIFQRLRWRRRTEEVTR